MEQCFVLFCKFLILELPWEASLLDGLHLSSVKQSVIRRTLTFLSFTSDYWVSVSVSLFLMPVAGSSALCCFLHPLFGFYFLTHCSKAANPCSGYFRKLRSWFCSLSMYNKQPTSANFLPGSFLAEEWWAVWSGMLCAAQWVARI